jgi:hypothetical protein
MGNPGRRSCRHRWGCVLYRSAALAMATTAAYAVRRVGDGGRHIGDARRRARRFPKCIFEFGGTPVGRSNPLTAQNSPCTPGRGSENRNSATYVTHQTVIGHQPVRITHYPFWHCIGKYPRYGGGRRGNGRSIGDGQHGSRKSASVGIV